MTDPLQRRLLERELEFMCFFGRGIATDLEKAEQPNEVLTLVRGLLAVSLKISRLLWPFGRRAGDELPAAEAAELRAEMKLGDGHPLSPTRCEPYAEALRLRSEELLAALEPDRRTIRLADGSSIGLRELAGAMGEVRGVAAAAQEPLPAT